jgi:C-terminal processing protease CtpA/Prc
MLARLPNGDVMQHVVGDFAAPDGRRIEAQGVAPDERVPLSRESLLKGHDDALLAALAWIGERSPAATASVADSAGATSAGTLGRWRRGGC